MEPLFIHKLNGRNMYKQFPLSQTLNTDPPMVYKLCFPIILYLFLDPDPQAQMNLNPNHWSEVTFDGQLQVLFPVVVPDSAISNCGISFYEKNYERFYLDKILV